MSNPKKRNLVAQSIFKNSQLCTKIYIYFSTRTKSDDYDDYEKNYTYTNLNPKVIKGYVSEIEPESLAWRGYGFKEIGAKEILCEERYGDMFRLANKIVIEGDNYVPYRDAPGGKVMISKRPYSMIRVVISKT